MQSVISCVDAVACPAFMVKCILLLTECCFRFAGETNIRINELKKETYEFKRDIVMGGENSATRKV